MASGGDEPERSLEQTPTWVVATVATVFVLASLLLERAIYRLGKKFKRSPNQKELFHTLEQIKNELMLLGFISLLLTVFQPKVASICMPERLAHRMLPCPYEGPATAPAAGRRLLATEATTTTSCKEGYVPVISVEGLHQLHIFIFVLAVIHVLYSCTTVLVGLAQVQTWKKWETEAHEDGARIAEELVKKKDHSPHGHPTKNGHPTKEHSTSFAIDRIKYKFLHNSCTGLNLDAYVYSFFKQFGRPIYRVDYLALRMGFIGAHHLPPTYDFHGYIRRSMEVDFKRVVGISAILWAFVCIFLLLNMTGWYTYFWVAFIPTILVLIVGAKLQQIIVNLALQVRGGVKKINLDDLDNGLKKADHPVGVEMQPLKPCDDLFWCRRPKILIKLIHFILFQYTYGFSSCLMGKRWMVITRLGLGAFVQILCSSITLPLYALVSLMGTTFRETILKEGTLNAILAWQEQATKKTAPKNKSGRHSGGHPLGRIMGLNKTKDGEGHIRDIALFGHHTQPHDEPHNIEIHQGPLVIIQASELSNLKDHDNESQVPPNAASSKPSSFSSVAILALEKNRRERQGLSKYSD